MINDFSQGIQNGAGAPSRLMLITGQHGSGKTVLLTELGRVAASYGWDVIAETASQGMTSRLVDALRGLGPRIGRATINPSVTLAGASVSLGSVELEAHDAPLTLRAAIEDRLRKLPTGAGILFTVDEMQAAARRDVVAIATAVQHVIRDEDMTDLPDTEKHGIAFVFAGLGSVVDELVNDDVLTFLRRCVRHDLGNVRVPDVKNAYLESVRDSGKSIASSDALIAARASDGFPYMVQLIGYYMWQAAQTRHSDEITQDDIRSGIADATTAFQDAVCVPIMRALTPAQREFVYAMRDDYPDSSNVSEIARRCKRSRSWASKYRASLIQENVIVPAGKGCVELAVPHLGEYLVARRADWH